jgi:hypothetical protein
VTRFLTYDCGNCKRPRDLDVSAQECDRCERIVCPTCWDDTFDRCVGCVGGLYLTDEDVTEALRAQPGMIADTVWRVIRWAWLKEHPGKKGPAPIWWRDRVRDEIKSLRQAGVVECAHGAQCVYQRHSDIGVLCEFRLIERKEARA